MTIEARPGAADGAATARTGPRDAGPTAAGYTELTAQQFAARRELVVLLLKAPHAAGEFAGFQGVVPLPNSQLAAHYVVELGRNQPVGLVCPDGECSSRLAIRLARAGFTVHHLAGGLREWYRLDAIGQAG